MSKIIVVRTSHTSQRMRDWGDLESYTSYKYYVYANKKLIENLLICTVDEKIAISHAEKMCRLFGSELEITYAKLYVVEVPIRANSFEDALDKVLGDDVELRKNARARLSGE